MEDSMSGFQNGDDLSLRSFEETDVQEVEHVWTEIQTKRQDFRKLDDLSLQSFDPEDFVSDREAEGQEKHPLDEPLDRPEPPESTNALHADWYLQVDALKSIHEDLKELYHMVDTALPSDFTPEQLQEIKTVLKGVELNYAGLDRPEPPESTNALRADWYLQVDALKSIHEDLKELYHMVDTALPSDFTPEQLQEIKTVLKGVELNYAGLDRSESTTSIIISSPLPTVAQSIHIRLAPIAATDLSFEAQVLLQKGSGELKQVTTKKLGKGRKKLKVTGEDEKKKSKGKRFLQWLKRKLSCCCCVDV